MLQEAAQLAHADARPLRLLQLASQPRLQLRHILRARNDGELESKHSRGQQGDGCGMLRCQAVRHLSDHHSRQAAAHLRLTVSHRFPEVLVGAENGVLAVAHAARGHGAAAGAGVQCYNCWQVCRRVAVQWLGSSGATAVVLHGGPQQLACLSFCHTGLSVFFQTLTIPDAGC